MILISYGFLPLIDKPSRITNSTSTLIDNIFSNNVHKCSFENGLIYSYISDHLPIFAIQPLDKQPYVNMETKRQINQKNINYFKERLQETDWTNVFIQDEPYSAFSAFEEKLEKCYDESFPFKVSI